MLVSRDADRLLEMYTQDKYTERLLTKLNLSATN